MPRPRLLIVPPQKDVGQTEYAVQKGYEPDRHRKEYNPGASGQGCVDKVLKTNRARRRGCAIADAFHLIDKKDQNSCTQGHETDRPQHHLERKAVVPLAHSVDPVNESRHASVLCTKVNTRQPLLRHADWRGPCLAASRLRMPESTKPPTPRSAPPSAAPRCASPPRSPAPHPSRTRLVTQHVQSPPAGVRTVS